MLKINLGSSDDHKPGFLNVDIAPPADVVHDLNTPWPWGDSTVEYIYAHDVFEHLSGNETQKSGQIWAMNEAHRVLCPGGTLDLAVPCVHLSDGRVNPGAFADPTHRSYYCLDTRYYFNIEWSDPKNERGRFGDAYGITALFRGDWKLVEYGQGVERRSKVMALLTAVK